MKIYFAGAIRGGREDAQFYKFIIEYLGSRCQVLTEHVGYQNLDNDGEKDKILLILSKYDSFKLFYLFYK